MFIVPSSLIDLDLPVFIEIYLSYCSINSLNFVLLYPSPLATIEFIDIEEDIRDLLFLYYICCSF